MNKDQRQTDGGAESRRKRQAQCRALPNAETRQVPIGLPKLIQPRPAFAAALQAGAGRGRPVLALRPVRASVRIPFGRIGRFLVCSSLVWAAFVAPAAEAANAAPTPPKTFELKGRVQEVRPGEGTVVIAHEAISNYMPAMVMPFRAKDPKELAGLRPGDLLTCQLTVTSDESWIEHIQKTGEASGANRPPRASAPPGSVGPNKPHHPLLDYPFTNQLGQVVHLADFHGQALAITFFFTRCPIPDFCPRLSKNFSEALQKLRAQPNAPTNWHFISVSFDPQFDTPAVLKAYADQYGCDAAKWTFLTGPVEAIDDLARESGVTVEREAGGLVNHNFRTLVIDAAGHLQMVFPTSGDLSDALVSEMLKAMRPARETADSH